MNYNEKFQRFYNSKEWQMLRAEKFADANGICEKCKKELIDNLEKTNFGDEVHHIIPIEKDWEKRLDYDNLILLCKECHQEEHCRSGNLNDFLNKWDKGDLR